jgi:hypothetical protein
MEQMAITVDGIKDDLDDMKGDMKDNLDEIMDDLDEIKDGMGDIKDDVGEIKDDVGEIKCSCSATPSPLWWRLKLRLREPDRTGGSQMVFPPGPICKLQHRVRGLPKGNCRLVLSR